MRTSSKTTLMASIAIASIAAHAQSSVTLGGQIKVGIDHVKYSDGNSDVPGPGSATRLTDNSTWWYVKGEEDLGGGTKAFFHIESGINITTGAQGSGRFHGVGLSHKDRGRLILGQWSTYFASDSILSPEGISNATPYATGTLNVLGSIGSRGRYFSGGFLPNTVRYESPRWNRFGFSASYAFDGGTNSPSGTKTYNLNPTYLGEAWTLYANKLLRKGQPGAPGSFTTTYDQDATRLGVGYLFDNGVKVAFLWDRNTVKGSAIAGNKWSRDAWALPVSYTTGPHKVSLTVGKANSYKVAGTTNPDTGATMLALSYQYALSKRTFFSTALANVNNESNAGYDFWFPTNTLATPANYRGFKSRYVYAGVKHVF